MDRDPYAPPKSEVKDLRPEAPSYRVRTKWLFLLSLPFLVLTLIDMKDALLPALTTWTLVASVALTISLVIWPLRAIAARRAGPWPLWWSILGGLVLGMAFFGLIADDPTFVLLGVPPLVALSAVFVTAIWVIEARYSLRVYSTGRGLVFIPSNDGL